MDTNNLSHLAKIISDLANSNLEQLQGKCQDEKDMQDYYLGILQKQALLLLDLSTILKNRQSKYISTPYIILRSLLDDFMHLMYLELSNNKEEEIIKINAEAYKHCFVSLQNLTDSNYEHFDGKYPFYLKQEEVEKVKNQFINKDKNKKYFKDGQYLTGMRKIHGEVYYFSPKGFMKTGWIKYNNKKYYFDSNGIRYSGVKKISGKYYYFSDKGVLRTKTVKVGNTIYYCTEKGILEAWKKGKTIYYPNGKKMNSTKAYEYETLQRAKNVVSKITKPSMSKSEKFETCFRWVMYQHYYDTRRIFYNQTAWPALYANDYLILSGKGGDCFSDACSFAYLAKALGYKNVYVCVDTTATDGSGHCWAEIGGRVYDPLFAEAKSYYGYFGVGYGSYGLYPERRVAV